MPLEFALRPRIKIPEGFAPPRRSRFRLPKLVLPVVGYWLFASGITYGLIRAHAQPDAPVTAQPLVAQPEVNTTQEWWQPVPARALEHDREPTPSPPAEPATDQVPAVDDSPLMAEPTATSTPTPGDDDGDGASASASREHHEKRAPNSRATDDAPADAPPPSRTLAHDDIRAPDSLLLPPLASEPSHDTPPPLLGAMPPDAPAAIASALPNCDAAAAAANQDIDIAHRDGSPDLSRETIATVLDNGVWIARCDIPMSSSIELCVAIKGGVVIGASVTSHPSSAAINACVKRRAAGLHFPFSSRVDIARTHF